MLLERVAAQQYRRVQPTSTLHQFRFPIVFEHQERYKAAAQEASKRSIKTIFDAASGCGWGTYYLATHTQASKVIGIDLDPSALTEAKHEFPHKIVQYRNANLVDSKKTGSIVQSVGPADFIASFETLEHIEEELVPDFLNNLSAMSRPNAQLMISSPNGPVFSPYSSTEGRPWYQYHTKEYNPDELTQVLESNGWQVDQLYGQRFINEQQYYQFAKCLFVFRVLGTRLKLPWDHRLMRIPFSILQRYSALTSDHYLQPLNDQSKTPIYLTALCSKKDI